MSKEIRILFTGVGRRVELVQAFREASICLDIPLKIYGADLTDSAPAIYYCDYYRPVCGMKELSYIPSLLSICEKDSIDLLIPTIDTDLLILSECRSRFEEIGTEVMISAPDKIKICRDKNYTSAFFESCGLNAPKPVNDWTLYTEGYPAFIKPKDGSSSINAYKVETKDELELFASQIEDYIVQPYIDGPEFTIDVFCDWEGNPLSIVPRERLQIRAGEVLKTKITLNSEMIDEASAICKKFKPCGPITIQLIKDRQTGKNYYIEINPRFGGGAPLSMKAGSRSADLILQLLSNRKISYVSSVADGSVYSRFDQSICISSGKSEIKGVIFDLDDTLYSEKEYVRSGFQVIAKYLGDDIVATQLWNFFEEGKPAIDCLLEKWNRPEMKNMLLEVYRSHEPNISLYNGVEETILSFRKKGIKVGIITDGRPEGQRKKIQALGLESLVDDIIITDELGGVQFRKPCDISFRIIQTRWRIPFSNMAYIGDNRKKDFIAPKQLGMISVIFDNYNGLYRKSGLMNEGFDYSFDDYSMLRKIMI